MAGAHGHGPKRLSTFTIFVIIYVAIAVLAVALAPFTGGRTLAVLCFEAAVVVAHGYIYVMTSRNTGSH